MARRLHVYISGRVQGVGFRDATRRKAQKLGLTGWVRNLDDGRVEAEFEGDRDDLVSILDWCQKGPVLGRVQSVDSDWRDDVNGYDGFEIRF